MRELRQRRLRERQMVIFGLIGAVLLVATLGSLAVFNGAIATPLSRGFTTEKVEDHYADVKEPCIPDNTLPLDNEKENERVIVAVYNAANRKGLGGANVDMLSKRGFNVKHGTYTPDPLEQHTVLRFGVGGVRAAYTVAQHYDHPTLLLDAREGAGVDVLLGKDFENLTDEELIDPTKPLTSVKGCKPADEITPRPVPTAPATSTESATKDATN